MPSESLNESTVAWLPDLIYTGERFERGVALVCDADGRIVRLAREKNDLENVVRLKDRALLPGMVNAHSHAFQRVIRGRTERRTGTHDSFWTWREMMYSAATRLTPESIYDAARMAFLEMVLSGRGSASRRIAFAPSRWYTSRKLSIMRAPLNFQFTCTSRNSPPKRQPALKSTGARPSRCLPVKVFWTNASREFTRFTSRRKKRG